MRPLMRACLLSLWIATANATPPDPVESQFLVTRLALFKVTASEGVSYHAEFEVKQPFDKPVYVTVEFENPADPHAPFLAKPKLMAGEKDLFADSEGFRAIRNPGQFLIKVSLYEDAPRKVLIGTHEQKLEFDIPRKYLKQLRLKAL